MHRLFYLLVLTYTSLVGQSTLSNERIWKDFSFLPTSINGFQWLADKDTYSLIRNHNTLLKFRVGIESPLDTLFYHQKTDSTTTTINSYTSSANEQYFLIATNTKSIYRRSFTADYLIKDQKSNNVIEFPVKGIQVPSFSPNSKFLAYVKENNLYYTSLTQPIKEKRITTNGQYREIINGHTDWAYEEEFGFTKAYEWSPDGKKIAYLQFNEQHVKEYELQVWGNQLYPQKETFKYPKVGEKVASIRVMCYDLETQESKEILHFDNKEVNQERYVTQLQWLEDSQTISLTLLNRAQNQLTISHTSIDNLVSKKIYYELASTYIELPHLSYFSSKKLLFSSERTGFKHLYVLNYKKDELKPLTSGKWDVDQIISANSNEVFFTAGISTPRDRSLYALTLKNKKLTQLITGGTITGKVNTSGTYLKYSQSFIDKPSVTNFHNLSTSTNTPFISNDSLYTKLKGELHYEAFQAPHPTYDSLLGYIQKPEAFDSTKKYPVLFYVYGGPGYQTVTNKWKGAFGLWHQYIANQGYIVVLADGIGTGARGRRFRDTTYQHLGDLEVESMVTVATYLKKLPYVDSSRIGIWGWSFGGYLSTLCLLKAPDVFSTAIAVAPVTDWRFYDAIYTERYMGLLTSNEKGYTTSAPMNYVDQLKGNFLLIHGTGDDNVHIQHSMALQNALIKSNKQFDSFFYPDLNHSIPAYYHLFTKMSHFILEKL